MRVWARETRYGPGDWRMGSTAGGCVRREYCEECQRVEETSVSKVPVVRTFPNIAESLERGGPHGRTRCAVPTHCKALGWVAPPALKQPGARRCRLLQNGIKPTQGAGVHQGRFRTARRCLNL